MVVFIYFKCVCVWILFMYSWGSNKLYAPTPRHTHPATHPKSLWLNWQQCSVLTIKFTNKMFKVAKDVLVHCFLFLISWFLSFFALLQFFCYVCCCFVFSSWFLLPFSKRGRKKATHAHLLSSILFVVLQNVFCLCNEKW